MKIIAVLQHLRNINNSFMNSSIIITYNATDLIASTESTLQQSGPLPPGLPRPSPPPRPQSPGFSGLRCPGRRPPMPRPPASDAPAAGLRCPGRRPPLPLWRVPGARMPEARRSHCGLRPRQVKMNQFNQGSDSKQSPNTTWPTTTFLLSLLLLLLLLLL